MGHAALTRVIAHIASHPFEADSRRCGDGRSLPRGPASRRRRASEGAVWTLRRKRAMVCA